MCAESSESKHSMGGGAKAAIVLLLAGAVFGVVYMRAEKNPAGTCCPAGASATPSAPAATSQPTATTQAARDTKALPRLVDLGANKCQACKMMEPVLEELRHDYRGKLDVVFIDVWKDKQAAEKYGVRIIPTQIFLDPSGKELFRHQGFLSKKDIVAKWKELGFDLSRTTTETAGG